jgi:hypothetical protein
MNQHGAVSKTSHTRFEETTSTSLVAQQATSTISLRCHLHIGQPMQVVGESLLSIPGAKAFSSQAARLLRLKHNGYKLNYYEQKLMGVAQRS